MIVDQIDRFIGQSIADGRYEVVDLLGEGAMGMIFRAMDTRLAKEVVIKVPAARVVADPEFMERFQREIRSLVQLSHPHVVNIIDVGEHENTPFLVMQYLPGGSLADRLVDAGGKMRPSSLTSWLKPMASAVDFVHTQDVIHRDVKPANILFDAHGNAFLADFGLSKVLGRTDLDERANALTAAGFVVGTPQYVAPEIVMGQAYDGRADQYSLAMTVYEVLAGESPVAGSTPSATMVNQINIVPPLLDEKISAVPPALAKAVAKGLEKNPQKRFESCSAFANAVLSCLTPTPPPSAAPARKPRSGEVAQKSVLKSKGTPGKVPCPQCKNILPLKDQHRGRKGKCVHCGVKLQVGSDLSTLMVIEDPPVAVESERETTATGKLPPRVLKPKPRAGSKRGKKADEEANLGEEVFGWRLNRVAISILTVALILILVGASAFIGRKTNEKEESAISAGKNIEHSRKTEK